MGAWGHGPFDNDRALDWVSDVATPEMWNKLRITLEGEGNDEIRAAARFVRCITNGCRAAGPTDFDITEVAVGALERVLKDGDWLRGWDDPGKVRNDIITEIEFLKGIPLGTSLFGGRLP